MIMGILLSRGCIILLSGLAGTYSSFNMSSKIVSS